jgi:hypothetical protein
VAQHFQLGLPPDESSSRKRDDGLLAGQLEQPPRFHRRRPILDRQRLERVRPNVRLDQPVGAVSEEDLPGLCRLLQPCSDIDGIASREGVSSRARADKDVPGIHADSHGELDAAGAHQLVGVREDRVTQFDGGPYCSQRVVFVELGQPEETHYGVADELLGRSSVALENLPCHFKVPREDPVHRLRIEELAETGRLDYVCKDDGRRSPAVNGLPR